jgi:flagellar motor switch protein FliM
MGREAMHEIPQADALTTGELRSLQTLHEGLPHAFAVALSTLLRNPVEVRLAAIDQLPYGKFVHSLEDPTYFSVLKAEPLGDRVLLDIELAILYPILDRLLGGHADDPPPRRPPSDLELPLAARIVRVFLKDLQDAWQNVLPLQFEVLQVGSHPRLLRVLPSDESVVLLNFALTIGNRQGAMRLCFPCRAIRQIADQSAARGRLQPSSVPESDGSPTQDAEGSSPGVEVIVTLASTSIAAGDIDGLRVGDIILTETAADTPAAVSIDGEPKCRGKPAASQGRKAVVLSLPGLDAPS